MATANYFAVTAVKHSGNTQHHHYISHVFMHLVINNVAQVPGKIYTKDEAIKLMATNSLYTHVWRYANPAGWIKGALVEIETVGTNKYLRSHKDNTTQDNLSNLIDYDYFGKV